MGGNGVLNITNGGRVTSGSTGGLLGNGVSATGIVNVDGTGSKWTSTGIGLGYQGTGILNITNGGLVTNSGSTVIALRSPGTGVINFGANGGTLTTQTLYAGSSQITGTGTIQARGLVTDCDLVFDAAHGLSQTFSWVDLQKNMTVQLDLTGSSGAVGDLGAGYQGTGTLMIRDGATVSSVSGYLGYQAGSAGTAAVDGSGSSWTNTGSLYVGNYGGGTLSITNSGKVSSGTSYLGYYSGSAGMATVDGSGSTWTNSGLYVGNSGAGALNIFNGGLVTVNGTTYVGNGTASTGAINFGVSGGTLTTKSLYGGPGQMSGVGTINTRGLVNDGLFVFDASHGAKQTAIWANSQGNLTVNLDLTGASGAAGDLGAGNVGTGTMTIGGGVAVSCANGILGYRRGANGLATVDGTGSNWTCTGSLTVGNYGTGTLNVTSGGRVSGDLRIGVYGTGTLNITSGGSVNGSPGICYLGSNAGSAGSATVDGTGSTLTSRSIYVGDYGTGSLSIANGGSVSAPGEFKLGHYAGSTGTATVGGAGSTLTGGSVGLSGTLSFYVGYSGSGLLNVVNGGSVNINSYAYVGSSSGSTGAVAVDGVGSRLTSNYGLTIGYSGTGMLNIVHGGLVNLPQNNNVNLGYVGYNSGSAGTVTVSGNGSSLSSYFPLSIGYSGTGTLNILDGGNVSAGGYTLGVNVGSAGTVNLDGGNTSWSFPYLDIGLSGTGTLRVTGGAKLSLSDRCFVGHVPGSTGTAIVDGSASTWSVMYFLYVGYAGSGVLQIAHGGKVTDSIGAIGPSNSSTGTAIVDGVGSSWTNSGTLTVGYTGTGGQPSSLMVFNGGKVSAGTLTIGQKSMVAMTVGDGSQVSANTGALNNGVIRLTAAASATTGAYTPIVSGSWSGSGTVTALGGSWDTGSHVFTVSDMSSGTTGEMVLLDTLATQRVVITEPTSGDCVQVGFQATAGSNSLTFGAAGLTDAQTALLASGLPEGASVLDGWNFTTSGYTAGDPVYVSMKVGAGRAVGDMTVWHYDGSAWTAYAAGDLSYDGMYASWTVNGFSGYAVTAVPEPVSLGVLGIGAWGMLLQRRKGRGRRQDAVTRRWGDTVTGRLG
jgi:T5SS/PEP-CTERM-associated repeat protein